MTTPAHRRWCGGPSSAQPSVIADPSASCPEPRGPRRGDGHGHPGGAAEGARGLVDVEVVEREPALNDGPQRRWLDHRGHVVVEVVAELAGTVTGVAQHLGAGRFAIDQLGCHLGVADVAGGKLDVGDQPGVGLGGDVRLVAVAGGVGGLVGVARLGIDRGHDAGRGGALGDPPRPGPLTGLHVLAGDERQQGNRVGQRVGELQALVDEVLGRPHELVGVIDELGDQPVDVVGARWATGRPAALGPSGRAERRRRARSRFDSAASRRREICTEL